MSKLRDLQQAAIDLIKADPWFEGVKILTRITGNIESQIEEALGQLGLVIVCIIAPGTIEPKGRVINLKAQFAFMVVENVLLNRSGDNWKTAEDAVERMLALLHYKPNGQGHPRNSQNVFRLGSPAFEPIADDLLVYRVNIETEVTL